jgi:hypothetical protein
MIRDPPSFFLLQNRVQGSDRWLFRALTIQDETGSQRRSEANNNGGSNSYGIKPFVYLLVGMAVAGHAVRSHRCRRIGFHGFEPSRMSLTYHLDSIYITRRCHTSYYETKCLTITLQTLYSTRLPSPTPHQDRGREPTPDLLPRPPHTRLDPALHSDQNMNSLQEKRRSSG